ncbi:MAG TPA: 2-C-methyl-D-erythritol 4-phosphate cytidylyltransferase [Methylomirabilota bacterium]|nr:2-C-methyl-D-erythritol 4-phosphate cytidylyltransferase [Methylomirabilota bacterium]
MPRVAVLIPAGGVGTRLGRRTPKQFLRLRDATILGATLRHFTRHPAVRAVVVAAPAAHLARTRRLVARAGRCPVDVVAGGASRQESVWLALQAAPPDAEIVLVHDAVRPFIERRLIDAVVAKATAHGAAVCALPIAETIKRVRDGVVETTLDRSGLWAVQTPQGFRHALLREAHEKARRDGVVGTDDAALVERLGQPVRVVAGLAGNLKITTPEDLRRARGRR